MFRHARLQLSLSKGTLASYFRIRHYHSPKDMRFRTYPRSFPVAMINIMQHGKNFLKVHEFEDNYTLNCVQFESDGLIDPYLAEVGDGSQIPCEFQNP